MDGDTGMETPTHTPHGRGYDSGLSYFSHGNWMWSQAEWLGSCARPLARTSDS